jgi:hypothetical protein
VQGRWTWKPLPAGTLQQIIDKLPDFERLRSKTDINKMLHPIPLARLCKDARDRLKELQQDDTEHLQSWRITQLERLWCVERDGVMCVLWWDPNHEVCPVSKKHT